MMKLFRLLVAFAALTGMAAVAYVHHAAESSGEKMTNAAERFVASLDADQRGKAVYDFDDKERLNWHFVPLQDAQKQPTRKGLRLQQMTAQQKDAAKALLRTGTSPSGYVKATTIISLESILRELEKGGANVRNPEWYFFTVFGTPSKSGKWGWRVEGHHLSLNFTIDGGSVVAATPAFFGANPAAVKQGPRKGTRTLPEAEDLARDLFASLDDEQKRMAYHDKQFPEIQGQTRAPKVGEPRGLRADKMNDSQRKTLVKLLQSYADRMPEDVASVEMCEVQNVGMEQIYFAYAGEPEPGKPHTYRIQGPTVLIEFLNIQADSANNPANHIHSVWRNVKGDFGLTH
jgi:hypothetical protein